METGTLAVDRRVVDTLDEDDLPGGGNVHELESAVTRQSQRAAVARRESASWPTIGSSHTKIWSAHVRSHATDYSFNLSGVQSLALECQEEAANRFFVFDAHR